jgi:hypothetical protein
MSTMLGIRKLNRTASIGLGGKDVQSNRLVFINTENARAWRDYARHQSIGQTSIVNPARFQLDTAQVDVGGSVIPRNGSFVLDVTTATLRYNAAGVPNAVVAAGTATVTPNATTPLIAAIGYDTSTPATPTVVVLNGTAAATVTEDRAINFPWGTPTPPAIDTTASRTWLALVWVPPTLAVTSVAGTGVFTTAAHNYKVGDSVWFTTLTGGAGLLANTLYTVATVPSTTTFTLTNGTHSTNITAGTVNRQILPVDVIDTRP